VRPSIQSAANAFFQALPKTRFMSWLSQYNTYGLTGNSSCGPGGNQNQARMTGMEFGGSFTINPQVSTLTDATLGAELDRQIEARNLPQLYGDTIYVVFLPPDVNTDSTCSSNCGFNSVAPHDHLFAVVPDYPCRSRNCGGRTWSGGVFHEVAELITDPFPSANAWVFKSASETCDQIGDACDGQLAPGVSVAGFPIQMLWSKTSGSCATPDVSCAVPCGGDCCSPSQWCANAQCSNCFVCPNDNTRCCDRPNEYCDDSGMCQTYPPDGMKKAKAK
jgi:hypothetical protein